MERDSKVHAAMVIEKMARGRRSRHEVRAQWKSAMKRTLLAVKKAAAPDSTAATAPAPAAADLVPVKAAMLREELGIISEMPVTELVNEAVDQLGLAEDVTGLDLEQKADRCLEALGVGVPRAAPSIAEAVKADEAPAVVAVPADAPSVAEHAPVPAEHAAEEAVAVPPTGQAKADAPASSPAAEAPQTTNAMSPAEVVAPPAKDQKAATKVIDGAPTAATAVPASSTPTVAWLKERGVHSSLWGQAFGSGGVYSWLMERVEKIGSGHQADEQLDFRSCVRDERKAMLTSIGVLFSALAVVDLRDNRLDDTEIEVLADALERDKLKLTKLSLAGNRVFAAGLASLSAVVTASELLVDGSSKLKPCSLTDLDLSRNLICRGVASDGGSVGESTSGLVELARVVAQNSRLTALALGRCGLSDAAGAAFCKGLHEHGLKKDEPLPAKAPSGTSAAALSKGPPPMALTRLDLSDNELHADFGLSLASALAVMPALVYLNLRGNGLGAEGGTAVCKALAKSGSLRTLDLAATNLCNCNPKYATSTQSTWCGDAIEALSETLLSGSTLQVVNVSGNELAGLWSERLGGGWAAQGTYTTHAVDALTAMLEKERLQLKKRGGLVFEGNHMLKHDWMRLERALLENEKKTKRAFGQPGSPTKKGTKAPVVAVVPTQEAVAPSKSRASVSTGFTPRGESDAAQEPADEAQQSMEEKEEAPADEEPASQEAESLASSAPPQVDVGGDADAGDKAASPSAAPAAAESSAPAEASSAEASPAAARPAEAASSAAAPAVAEVGAAKTAAERRADRNSKPGGVDGKKPSPTKVSKAVPAGSPDGKKAAASGGEKAGAPSAAPAKEPAPERASYKQTKGGEKKKKKAAADVVVEADPYAALPLFVGRGTLAARAEKEVESAPVKDVHGKDVKLGTGSLMRVIEEFEFVEGITKLTTKRMKVILDGDTEPVGWVTGLTRDGIENLRLASAGFPLRRAVKPLVCREGKETNSKKLDEIPKHSLLRILEEATMPDGTVRAKLAKGDQTFVDEIGWITLSKPGEDEVKLDDPPMLSETFNLKEHTAAALSRALKTKQTKNKLAQQGVRKKKGGDGGLPFQLAGRGPASRSPDEGSVSRHSIVTESATMILMFNCFGAAFEVTNWTGSMPFVLPDEQAFDLYPAKKTGDKDKGDATLRKKIGRVGLARELRAPFLERIEFPDEWMVAQECGVQHDGWQGPGILDLELTCGRDVATIQVVPWLAYSCSIGARINIRTLGSAQGQCATVDRILGDDRIVAKVDGFARADGVKGEVIVDLTPKSVVPTEGPGFSRGQRIFLLYKTANALVDAVVMSWEGCTDVVQGSRHMVLVKEVGAKTGLHAWPTLNIFNHVLAPPGLSAGQYEEMRARYCAHIASTQDTVEDAITGNSLPIADQLIFMAPLEVKDGVKAPDFQTVNDVPSLVEQLAVESPNRLHGGHLAQPVLCRAGPGTGKTWMIKQTLYLLSTRLSPERAGGGVRLMPFVVYVQRIVRMLSELGEDPANLLADPEGMLRWYIRNEYSDNKEFCQLLLLAYDMRALVMLVDGVDEAAGMRVLVESFVHYELVTSGNRLVVTSRPEGVDLEDYKGRFVVMNLLELSQEQQRNVIQMQLAGNKFFEHLVSLGECRRDLDARYRKAFPSEALQHEIQNLSVEDVDGDGIDDANIVKEDADAPAAVEAPAPSPDKKAKANDASETKSPELGRRGSTMAGAATESANASNVAPHLALVRRRVSLDNHADLQTWLAKALPELKKPLESRFLDGVNKSMMRSTSAYQSLLDQLETEIRVHPSPCTWAQVESAIVKLEEAQPRKQFSPLVRESIVQLALLRKLPLPGGRRGAKAAPVPASGLWCQVTRVADGRYREVQDLQPTINYVVSRLAATAGVRELALAFDDHSGEWIAGSAKAEAPLVYREPVALWLDCTFPGATEPTEEQPPAWCASVVVRCATGEQCKEFIKVLLTSPEVDLADELGGGTSSVQLLSLKNGFAPESHHPTHLRNASCHVLFTTPTRSIAIQLQVEHKDLLEHYETAGYHAHYDFFHHRVLGLSQSAFDLKFETLLIFLVEAIGIPVLLSLLLLTYSSTGDSDILALDELPLNRLQLYKLGIASGIRKRLTLAVGDNAGAAEVTEEAAEGTQAKKREKRKGALEQNVGGASVSQSGDKNAVAFQVRGGHTDPVLDLNSVLRGKKVRVVQGEDDVAEAYSLVVRCLERSKNSDLRSAISAIVPKSHSLHAVVTALVEFVLAPIAQSESALQETGKKMLRDVAVENQQNGRREFTSKHVACALGATPEELGLWTKLELDADHGVALVATLSKQSEKAPAQYQFKHLSFQEGLYAEYLLMMITSLQAPGPGWSGWHTDKAAAEFLNNRYMNNTCRIAAGHLGALLAKQRSAWDFREAPLTPNGRSALWFITDENDTVDSVNVARNDINADDVLGLANTIATCPCLQLLDLSENDLWRLSFDAPSMWSKVCAALSNNTSLTDLNLNNNKLGPSGIRVASKALLGCTGLKRLGLSYNEPGIEPAMNDFFRSHPALESVELVEALDRHLPNRAKDDIGKALVSNKARKLGFLQCDNFKLTPETTTIVWPKIASTSDAVLLAGALVTNTVLTTFNIAAGAQLVNTARSALGEALLNNPNSRLAFCNDFGLAPNVTTCQFDLSRSELKEVEPFRLLAGCLRGNRTLTHVTLKQLRSEQIPTLAMALRGNSTLNMLDIVHVSRTGGQSLIRLPVPELNGSGKYQTTVDMSLTCLEGSLGRVACEIMGTLVATNTTLQCLDLSNTGVGVAIGSEGEGGHILFRPLCESKTCPLNELVLNNIQLNDKAGAKLLSSLSQGLGTKASGYEKITSLCLANNELGAQTGHLLKEVLWGERAPCVLKYLDLHSNVDLAGHDIAFAIRRNESLTSIDLRGIPSANTDSVFTTIGTLLLQDECQCRLGLFACDAFRVQAEQTELVLDGSLPPAGAAPAPAPAAAPPAETKKADEKGSEKGKSRASRESKESTATEPSAPSPDKSKKGAFVVPKDEVTKSAILMLLAGVLKYNTSLRSVVINAMDLDDSSATNFYHALRENKTLENIDLANNLIGPKGVAQIAEAVRDHPSLETFKVDGAALPVLQVRGAKKTDSRLEAADWGLGVLSGFAIGTIAMRSNALMDIDLKNNALGASGAAAVVSGLGEAPVKFLDLSHNGIGLETDVLEELPRVAAPAGAADGDAEVQHARVPLPVVLSPMHGLCVAVCHQLGSLQELRMDENDLACEAAEISPLCKLRNLRTLCMDKNRLGSLPSILGTMSSLRKLSLHSNYLTELPPSFCLLSSLETLDLHKNLIRVLPPTIGQLKALQRVDLSENKLTELPISVCELSDELQLSVGRNPLEKPSIEQARQGIGAIRRFFGFSRARGGDEAESITAEKVKAKNAEVDDDEDIVDDPNRPAGRQPGAPSRHDWAGPAAVITLFNCSNCAFTLAEGSSDVETMPSDEAVELVVGFNLQPVGQVRPSKPGKYEPFAERVEWRNVWLPYKVHELELLEHYNLSIQVKWAGKQSATLVLTPWLSYGCSIGARIALRRADLRVANKRSTYYATVAAVRDDDTVELLLDNTSPSALLGPETIDPRPDTVTRTQTPAYKGGQKLLLMYDGQPHDAVVEEWLGLRRGSKHRVRLGGKESKKASRVAAKDVIEVDLNEANHTKLLFATVNKYELTRQQYCNVVMGRTRVVRNETILPGKDLPVADQRLFVDDWAPVCFEPEAVQAVPEVETLEGALAADAPADPAPVEKPPAESKAPEAASPSLPEGPTSILQLLGRLVDPTVARGVIPQPLILRAGSKAEHELLHYQVLYALAKELRDGEAQMGAIRLVPLPIAMSRMTELLADEANLKKPARDVLIKAFEGEYPGYGEMIKQAMEMRALVIIARVNEQSEINGLTSRAWDPFVDELLASRLVITCCATAEGGPTLTRSLVEQCVCRQLSSISFVLNNVKISDKESKNVLKRLRLKGEGYWHLVRGAHLASCDMGREALAEVLELLMDTQCSLESLDLSFNDVDITPIVQVLQQNGSLTALDVRKVPNMAPLYPIMAEMLLRADAPSRLGFMRCDAFEVLEEERTLSLRERPLSAEAHPGGVPLLAGLIAHNSTLRELDLTASDIDKAGADALATAIARNTSLTSLKLKYNPSLDDEAKAKLKSAVEKRGTPLTLEL